MLIAKLTKVKKLNYILDVPLHIVIFIHSNFKRDVENQLINA